MPSAECEYDLRGATRNVTVAVSRKTKTRCIVPILNKGFTLPKKDWANWANMSTKQETALNMPTKREQ